MAEATGQTLSLSKARENIFTSSIRMVLDNDDKVLTEDVGKDFYRELILMYTVPSDTVISINPSLHKSGKETSDFCVPVYLPTISSVQ